MDNEPLIDNNENIFNKNENLNNSSDHVKPELTIKNDSTEVLENIFNTIEAENEFKSVSTEKLKIDKLATGKNLEKSLATENIVADDNAISPTVAKKIKQDIERLNSPSDVVADTGVKKLVDEIVRKTVNKPFQRNEIINFAAESYQEFQEKTSEDEEAA